MPRNNSKAQREYRQKQATARQAERAQRSDAEQVTLLETRRGFSNKETHRLLLAAKSVQDVADVAAINAANPNIVNVERVRPKRNRKREVTQ